MSYQTMDLALDHGIARLTLNDAATGNAFGTEFCPEFPLVVDELANCPELRVVLLQARGKYFSVGGDISQFSRDLDKAPAAVRDGTRGLHMGMARLLRIDAPIVASVHATAMRGAVSILATCDLVYGACSAKFGAAYSELGFTCDLGASFGLASRMGIARARRYLLLGESLTSEDAQRGRADRLRPAGRTRRRGSGKGSLRPQHRTDPSLWRDAAVAQPRPGQPLRVPAGG
jgi:2-(1,2-epoxy-1,2-dihydrophenyl)acetyl-CoA isomerase